MSFIDLHLHNSFNILLTSSKTFSDEVSLGAVPESSVDILRELIGQILLQFSHFLQTTLQFYTY